MTHPLIEALDAITDHFCASPPKRSELRPILLALLRHPAMREPSGAVQDAMWDARNELTDQWTAGLDALAREVESS